MNLLGVCSSSRRIICNLDISLLSCLSLFFNFNILLEYVKSNFHDLDLKIIDVSWIMILNKKIKPKS